MPKAPLPRSAYATCLPNTNNKSQPTAIRASWQVGEKCFELPIKADGIFRDAQPGEPFGFDYEALLMPSRVQLHEMPVTFAPTYRLDETAHQASTSGTQARHYSSKRCPSWCDRIVMSPYARGRVPADGVECALPPPPPPPPPAAKHACVLCCAYISVVILYEMN